MHGAFSPFVTTIGTDQTMTIPLVDAETNGMPRLIVGPEYRRNNLRLFLRLPKMDEAERLPTPMGHDRKSITFEPYMLLLPTPLSPNATGEIYRIVSPDGRVKLSKKKFSAWKAQPDTAVYPALPISVPSMKPGETLEFDAVSYWHNPKRRNLENKLIAGWNTPPPVATHFPLQILVLVKMRWLPGRSPTSTFEYVNGSPVNSSMPMSPTAEAPQPTGPTEDDSNGESWTGNWRRNRS